MRAVGAMCDARRALRRGTSPRTTTGATRDDDGFHRARADGLTCPQQKATRVDHPQTWHLAEDSDRRHKDDDVFGSELTMHVPTITAALAKFKMASSSGQLALRPPALSQTKPIAALARNPDTSSCVVAKRFRNISEI